MWVEHGGEESTNCRISIGLRQVCRIARSRLQRARLAELPYGAKSQIIVAR